MLENGLEDQRQEALEKRHVNALMGVGNYVCRNLFIVSKQQRMSAIGETTANNPYS